MSVFSACLRAALLFVIVALYPLDAHAACSATTQDDLSVGDTGTDAACNYDTIQAAIDAATCPAGTRIHITNERVYTAQHLIITNKNVSLIARGATSHCGGLDIACGFITPCPTAPLASISGSGHSGDSVITIRGNSNVRLQYLTVIGGHDSDSGAGGGIDYAGTGTLTLDTSTVTGNSAGYGGGININGSPGAAELHIEKYTLITGNTATTSGGGVRVEGNAHLFMLADHTTVFNNHALNGYGGGVELVSPGRGDIGSPGLNGLGVIDGNDALYGGGIAVTAGAAAVNQQLRLFSTDSSRPVAITDNAAARSGGGIFLLPSNGSPDTPTLCGWDFRIDSNVAKEGAAIYADYAESLGVSYTSNVALNPVDSSTCSLPVALGAVHCASGVVCNTVYGNLAIDINNNDAATNGATVLLQTAASLAARHADFRHNQGGYVVHAIGGAADGFVTRTLLEGALLADNDVTAELIHSGGGGGTELTLDTCTLAHDQIAGAHVVYEENEVTVVDSIVNEPGIAALAFSGGAAQLTANYDVADMPGDLPADPTILTGAPTFIDAAHGDYRLRYSRQGGVVTHSVGLDYAPPVGGDDPDIRNLPRDQDLSGIADIGGNRDIGAYEMQPYADRIFADPFGDVLLLAY